MKITQALKTATQDLQKNNLPQAKLEAEVLLLEVIKEKQPKVNSAWLIANYQENLDPQAEKRFFKFIHRRLRGEPIAYIINRKEFYSRDFYVDKRVLIPRPETEILVEKAVEDICRASDVRRQMSILELGTGSGCIIISIIKELESKGINLDNCQFTATDISKDALDVAEKNANIYKVNNKTTFLQSDLFDFMKNPSYKLQATSYKLILANLPYVPAYWLTKSPSEYGLIHEPKIAIEGGEQGLELIDRFFSQVEKFLVKDGTIILEFGDDQKEKLINVIKKYLPTAEIKIYRDYQNLDRIALSRLTVNN